MPAWTLTEGADNFPSGGPPPPNDWKNTGSDQIFGLGGDDIINAGALADTVQAGEGNDEVNGGDDLDILLGNNGDDTLNGDAGNDSLSGENGIDTLHGNAGDDSLSGGLLGDSLFGDDGADTLDGNEGNDTIEGGIGADIIYTGSGSDIAHGGADNDTFGVVSDAALAGDVDQLFGDDGNDLLIVKGSPVDGWTASFDGGAGGDTVRAGNDIRHYSFSNVETLQSVSQVTATAAQFNQFGLFTDINGFSDVTNFNIATAGTVDFSSRLDASVIKLLVTGSIDGNTIIGGAGDDLLRGHVFFGGGYGPASVRLEGRGGNDTLEGSGGDDFLDGGAGADDMSGFTGHNVYIVDNAGDIVRGGGALGYDEMRTSLNSFNGLTAVGGNLIDKVVFTGAGNFTGILRAADGTMVGGAGNDTLTGASGGIFDGGQTFIGGGGNDTITGANDRPDTADYSTATSGVTVSLLIAGAQNTGSSTGSDTIAGIENLTGSNFADTLTGDAGNNVLAGLLGNDQLNGGGGFDSVDWSKATGAIVFTLNAAGGGVTASVVGIGQDTLTGFEAVIAGSGADIVTGNAAANLLSGNAGRDRLDGGAGDDTIRGGDEVGAGDLLLAGGAGGDTVFGGGGNDRIDGGTEIDTLRGEAGADTITGGDGNDGIEGGTEADIVYGQVGRDTVAGGDGVDTIYGGDEVGLGDALYGDAGNDHIQGGLGDDLIEGGAEIDKLYGEGGADNLAGGSGIDRLEGGSESDTLAGDAGNDVMTGGTGGDAMTGGFDIDRLDGNDGDDTLDGGRQNDNLTGGIGFDTYNFEAATASDAVFGFEDNIDTLRIDPSYGFANAAAVQAVALVSAGNIRILLNLATGDQIYLMGYAAAGGTIASLADDILIA